MFAVPTNEQATTETQAQLPAHLLVVDDDPMNRLLIRRMFEPEYRVTTAENGREALNMIQERPFDLVLLDVMMPGMNGFEVLQHLREQHTPTDLPVIMVTALHSNEDVVRGLQLGANDYLTKPVNIEVARARVQMQTTLKRLTDERKNTIHELETLQAMKETFFRTVSHDLKGPISNIRMAQYILSEMLSNDQDARVILDNIDLSLTAMQDMIQMFLDAALLQSGALELNLNCVSVNDAIQRVRDQYSLSARGKHIPIHLLPADEQHYALADSRLLNQVLSNLITNALKFSPPGTNVLVWAEGDRNWVRLNVADQGPGIPYEERKRLFQMFGKLSTRPVGSETSTGLGLWIVKSLVEMQGGKVGVDCPPDGGSIFWFELPGCIPSQTELR
jgi:two-component system, sensor histidine kinase and response regulator